MDFFFQCTTVDGQAFLHMWWPTVDRLGCGELEAKVKGVPLPLASSAPQPIGVSRA
jgi:hypothetical protein